jgi:hypothetical protein
MTFAKRERIMRPSIGTATDGACGMMKTVLGFAALSLAVAVAAPSADAKGCIKGALVGGAAGHFSGHHGLIGAAAGCAIGHHEAKKREKAMQNPPTNQPGQ